MGGVGVEGGVRVAGPGVGRGEEAAVRVVVLRRWEAGWLQPVPASS